jgi:hypothetical protein
MLANKGGYLGGSTIIRVHKKQSKTSKIRENRKRKRDAKLATELAAYNAMIETSPVQSASASETPPSKAGAARANRMLKLLQPMITKLQQDAIEFSKITNEPSSLVHDLAIYELQSLPGIIGVRRSLSGFDGWRKKTRVRALAIILESSPKDAATIPIMVDGLDREWDELCLIVFNDTYARTSVIKVSRKELCDVMRNLGWKNKSPAFVLPVSVIANLADANPENSVAENREPSSKGKKKKVRYLRPARKASKKSKKP